MPTGQSHEPAVFADYELKQIDGAFRYTDEDRIRDRGHAESSEPVLEQMRRKVEWLLHSRNKPTAAQDLGLLDYPRRNQINARLKKQGLKLMLADLDGPGTALRLRRIAFVRLE